jgi:hypothetical protein
LALIVGKVATSIAMARDGNEDPIPNSPWGIPPLGDGDGNNIVPTGNQTGRN